MKQVENHHMNKRKQSIIAGGLISSAGIFLAKFLGLFYAVPFNTILDSSTNLAIYGVSYSIYNYALNIGIAGFPFAIATLVAKYTARNDYKTALLVKSISFRIMVGFGLVTMLFMLVFATPFSKLLLPESIDAIETAEKIYAMRNALMILSIALFLVPILSSIRGFYQGLKHMEVYALSQVLEQIARISFLLITSILAVYVFHKDRIWAVYFGVISASIAAILAILHMKFYDRKQMKVIRKLAKEQQVVFNLDKMSIVKELVYIAFPYLIASILGYSDTIINTFFINGGLEAYYINNGGWEMVNGVKVLTATSVEEITTIMGAINYSIVKLMAIPMILAPGFSSAIIPHITSALESRNLKLVQKNIRDCVDIVLYIGLPISFCLFAYAKPIYSLLFYPGTDEALELCAQVLSWFSIEAVLSTIGPIFTSLMMAVGCRKLNIRVLAGTVALKFLITYPLIVIFGYTGLVISSLISMGIFIGFDAFILHNRFQIHWKFTLRKLLIILLGILGIYLVSITGNMIGLKGYGVGKIMGFVQLGISGTIALVVYFIITYMFGIPQALFRFDISRLAQKVKRK